MTRCILTSALVLSLATGSLSARAQVIVAPNANTTVEGNGRTNSAPFNNISRYQQIFSSSQFAGIVGPQLITQIAFRPDSTQASAFTHTYPTIQFDLSTTSTMVGNLSSTFSSNVGANDLVVYNGSLTLTTSNTLIPGGTTKAFDLVVQLANPFLYDPAMGNLLLDIRNSSSGFAGFVDAQGDPTLTPTTRLNFLDNSTTGLTGNVQSAGLVTQFTFQPVPEPGAVTLVSGLAVSSLFCLSRLRRSRKVK